MRPAVAIAIVAGLAVAVAVAMKAGETRRPTLGADNVSGEGQARAPGQGTASPASSERPCGDALACLGAGHLDDAFELAVRSDDPDLACVAAALLGRDDAAAEAGGASPRCLAARTWQLVAHGATGEAVVVAAAITEGPGLLARAEALWAAGLVDEALGAVIEGGRAVASAEAVARTRAVPGDGTAAASPSGVPSALVASLRARAAARSTLTPDDPRLDQVIRVLTALGDAQAGGEVAARLSEAWAASAP